MWDEAWDKKLGAFPLNNWSDLYEEEKKYECLTREGFTEQEWLKNVCLIIVQKRPSPASTVMGIIVFSVNPIWQPFTFCPVGPFLKLHDLKVSSFF